jgi:elongation factor P hydroxylase
MRAIDIVHVFHVCFETDFRVRLEGGAAEPYYLPASCNDDYHTIYFREDFASSALHEIAHWCIAGAARRLQPDFGYWYEGDRNADQQREFERLEVRPQALEWIFSEASATPFRVSCDNFAEAALDIEPFRRAVAEAVRVRLAEGLPPRADKFAAALMAKTGNMSALAPETYSELPP